MHLITRSEFNRLAVAGMKISYILLSSSENFAIASIYFMEYRLLIIYVTILLFMSQIDDVTVANYHEQSLFFFFLFSDVNHFIWINMNALNEFFLTLS